MRVSNSLVNAVSAGDVTQIRDALWGCIAIDSAFTEYFQLNYKYCLDNGFTEDKLFEPYDGKSIDFETTEDNFATLCGDLRVNFSKERLSKIKEMGRTLYPPKTTFQNENQNYHRTSTSSSSGTHSRLKEEPKKESASQMGSIITISAIIVVVVIILALILKK